MLEPASKNSSSAYQSLEDLLRRPLLSHSEDKEDNDNNDDADAAAEEPPHAAACMEDDDDEDEHDSEATTRVPHTGTSTLDHPRQRGGGCCAGSIVRRRPRSKPHRHQLTAMLSNYATSYNVVNISLVVPILQDLYYPPQQPDEDRHDAQIAAIAAALLAGMIVGQVLGGVCGDCAWLGKRLGALRWMLVIQVVAALASGFCRRHNSEELLWAIAAWRFVLGIGCGGVYPLAAVLSAEDHPSPNTTMQNNNNNTNNTNNTNNNPLPTSIAGSSAAALERVVLTFSTQGVGFVSVPLVAVIVLHCTENLELVWRLLLGLGALPGVLILVRDVYTHYSSEPGGGCCEYLARSSSSAAQPLLVSDFVRAGGNYDGLEYEIEDEAASENNIDDEDEDEDCENDSILASTCTAVDVESLLQTVLPTSKSHHEIHQAAAASIVEHDDTTIPQHIDDYEILTMTTTTNDRVFGGGGSGSGMNSSGGTSSEDDLDDDPSFGGGGNSDGICNNVNEEEEEEGGGGNDDEQRWIDTLFYEPGLGRKVLGTAGYVRLPTDTVTRIRVALCFSFDLFGFTTQKCCYFVMNVVLVCSHQNLHAVIVCNSLFPFSYACTFFISFNVLLLPVFPPQIGHGFYSILYFMGIRSFNQLWWKQLLVAVMELEMVLL